MNTLLKSLIVAVAGVFGFGLIALGVTSAAARDDQQPIAKHSQVALKRDNDGGGPQLATDDDDPDAKADQADDNAANHQTRNRTRNRTRGADDQVGVGAVNQAEAADDNGSQTRTRTGHAVADDNGASSGRNGADDVGFDDHVNGGGGGADDIGFDDHGGNSGHGGGGDDGGGHGSDD